MKLELFDYVKLKDGRLGHIVEIWEDGKEFDVEIDAAFWDKTDDWIVTVAAKDIAEKHEAA